MRISGSTSGPATRHHGLVVAVTALAAVAALALPGAGAAAAGAATVSAASVDRAAAVAERIGPERTAGFYHGTATGMVVNVTDTAAADAVRAAGAEPRLVDHSSADLRRTQEAIRRYAGVPGTAWSVDAREDALVVLADSTVPAGSLARIRAAADRFGDAVRVTRATGRLASHLSGGDPVYTSQWSCTLGFNAHSGSTSYFVTAGHCTSGFPAWYTGGGTFIGPTVGTSFPGNDYGLVRYDSSLAHPSAVGSQPISGPGTPFGGEHVCMRGATSGIRCGTLQGLGATVSYPGGTVSGLIDTGICSLPGDSGAPLYDGDLALGVLSGGTAGTPCHSYFQPITEVLAVYGLTL